jgi:uncharacterized membrane protein (DUF106 family)
VHTRFIWLKLPVWLQLPIYKNKMLERINDFCLWLMDPLLGWLLDLPSDLALLVLALLTALTLTLVRPLTTNQALLRSAGEDDRTLKGLLREARRRGDKEAVRRHKTTRAMIAMLKFKAEGWPLLLSLAPVALLATWAISRLEFHPPRAGEQIELVLYAPITAIDDVVHLVPVDGVKTSGGWVKQVTVVDEEPPYGEAKWTLAAEARPEPYLLTIRLKDRSLEHPLLVGQRIYAPALKDHGNRLITELKMRPVKLFNILPGWGYFLPAWLVGYLLISIPLVFLIRRLTRIC